MSRDVAGSRASGPRPQDAAALRLTETQLALNITSLSKQSTNEPHHPRMSSSVKLYRDGIVQTVTAPSSRNIRTESSTHQTVT